MDPKLSRFPALGNRVPDLGNGTVEGLPGATRARPVREVGVIGDAFGGATEACRVPGSQSTPGSPLGAKEMAFGRLDARGRGHHP